MWLFIGCGLRYLFPLVDSLSVLVTVRVYKGGPSAVVFLLGYFLVVWFVWDTTRPAATRPRHRSKNYGHRTSHTGPDTIPHKEATKHTTKK